MAFDLSRLRRGERIAASAAVVLLVDMFLGWYGPHDGPGGSLSAWESFSLIDLVLLVTIVVALGLAFFTATQRTVALPVTAAVLTTALAVISAVLVLFRVLIDQPGFSGGVPDAVVDNTIWAWVGLIACVAILYGGYLAMREEGTSLGDAADQARAAGRQARAAFDDGAPAAAEGGSAPPPAGEEPAAPPPPPPPPAAEEPPAPLEDRTAFGEPLAGARPGIDEHPQGDPAVGSTPASAPPPDENP